MSVDRLRSLPCWQGEITAEPLTGGLSNESWKVTDAAGQHVVRFGHDYLFHHVDRARELMTARAAHAAGFAPKVEYAAPGVMVSAFLDARTWTAADVQADPEAIATLLHRFHHAMPAHISGVGHIFWPFHVIRDYARTITRGNSPFIPDIPDMLKLAEALEAAQIPLPIIFGHHDMLPANILQTDRLWLIDFEYAGFGTAMFDLAGAASNANMTPDQSTQLLTAYFDQAPDERTQKAFDAMQCASLLRESMWAMVSDLHLDAPGANYAAYAQENLDALATALTNYRANHGSPK